MLCALFLKIALSAAELMSFGRRLWGAVKDMCYADKPETISALNDNIHEAIEANIHEAQSIMCLKIEPIV